MSMLMSAVAPALYHMNYLQAVVIGLVQGITELFPISSLGHTVLIPSWIGGTWATLVRQESLSSSPYLAFVVGLHLATAVVLIGFYIREWIRVVIGFVRSIIRRRIETDSERLAWLIVIATIPVGLLGLVLEHEFRVLFAKPAAAAIFLTINGFILLAGETYRRRAAQAPALEPVPGPGSAPVSEREAAAERRVRGYGPTLPASSFRDERIVPFDGEAERELSRIGTLSAFFIGAAQSLALLAGISREGVAMVGGLYRGLSNENALRFSFLLSTPVILAAGVLKVPDLLGPLGNGIRGQVVAGSLAALVTSLLAVIFLSKYFKTRTLRPFAAYSILFGVASIIRFAVF
jgi:undecaprenyl-diphosphatase